MTATISLRGAVTLEATDPTTLEDQRVAILLELLPHLWAIVATHGGTLLYFGIDCERGDNHVPITPAAPGLAAGPGSGWDLGHPNERR